MPVIFETLHLQFRQLNTDDAAFVLRLLNSPGWLHFIGDRGVGTLEEAQLYVLTGPMSSYMKHGFGLYLVEHKETALPIGICGLIKREALEDVDLGYAFLPEFCGKGHALEAAQGTLRYAKYQLDIERVVAVTDMENKRSIHLLKKLGMVFERKVRFADENKDLFLFAHAISNSI